MHTLRLTLRMLERDLRAGALTVVGLAILLAVAALTSVGFLADRVQRAVENEAHQLLGGDLLLTADHPWDEAFREAARAHGLRLAESATFPSMVASDGGVQLAEIKAVSPEYPLRGSLRTAPGLNLPDAFAPAPPPAGSVWPDARLASALAVTPGERLKVGAGETAVAAILSFEPDRGINPFALAPRLLMPLGDLAATGLIQPGSRVAWRLHLAGEAPALAAFRQWAETQLRRGERIEGLDNARPEIRNVIERAQRFLRLAALLTVVVAAVAVGLAARRYMQTHLDACAVMRCVGASQRQILGIHGGAFMLLGLAATLLGGLLGYLLQQLLQVMLGGLLASELPPAGWLPWLHGLAVGGVLVLGFVMPPLLRLRAVPTLRVLRREWGQQEALSYLSYLTGLACLAALMLWMAGDWRLGGIVLAGYAIAIAGFALLGRGLLALLRRIPARRLAGGWRLGLANLHRHTGTTLLQVVALALGLTALLMLGLARNDLLAAWQARVPADAPNRFIINIQPEQRAAIADFFRQRGLAAPELEPMVRGRLMQVNGRAIAPRDFSDERARRLVEREFNLSQRDQLPAGNRITAGKWHAAGSGIQFSVETGLAETLNLHVGDELRFEIAGQPLLGRIASLRRLDWDSMRVNFFVIAPLGSLDGQPTSYITSFHLPAGREDLVPALVRQLPNLTVIDVAMLLQQLQTTVDQVTRAVQLIFGFAFLAGLVVLYAALQSSAAERRHELAVLRALGGRRRQLRQTLMAEFATLGALAGLLAGIASAAIGLALARWALHLDYLPSPWLPLTGMAVGSSAATLIGLAVTWRANEGSLVEGLANS